MFQATSRHPILMEFPGRRVSWAETLKAELMWSEAAGPGPLSVSLNQPSDTFCPESTNPISKVIASPVPLHWEIFNKKSELTLKEVQLSVLIWRHYIHPRVWGQKVVNNPEVHLVFKPHQLQLLSVNSSSDEWGRNIIWHKNTEGMQHFRDN